MSYFAELRRTVRADLEETLKDCKQDGWKIFRSQRAANQFRGLFPDRSLLVISDVRRVLISQMRERLSEAH